MLLTYPKNEHDSIYNLYLRWDDTARMLVKDRSDFDDLNKLLDEFIETLSKAELRFDHSEHIPEERLEWWQDEREEVLDEFEDTLQEKRKELLRDREPSGDLTKVAEEYNETVANLMQAKNDGQ